MHVRAHSKYSGHMAIQAPPTNPGPRIGHGVSAAAGHPEVPRTVCAHHLHVHPSMVRRKPGAIFF